LLLGTSRGNVKAWNVENKRIVCDTSGDEAFPCFADLQCSPTENFFVCATASHDPVSLARSPAAAAAASVGL
jgi:hypothetical protein